MPYLNHCLFSGHVGRAASMKSNSDGSKHWYELNLAVSTGFTERETMWIKCTAFGKVGEKMLQKANKGDLVAVSGKFSTRRYQKRDGQNEVECSMLVNDFTWIKPSGKSEAAEIPQFDLKQSELLPDGLSDESIPF